MWNAVEEIPDVHAEGDGMFHQAGLAQDSGDRRLCAGAGPVGVGVYWEPDFPARRKRGGDSVLY